MLTSTPSPPVVFQSEWGKSLLENINFEQFQQEIINKENFYEKSTEQQKKIMSIIKLSTQSLQNGNIEEHKQKQEELLSYVNQIFEELKNNNSSCQSQELIRNEFMNDSFASVIRIMAYSNFLQTGNLIKKSECENFSNEEYLRGVMLFTQDLVRYSMGRAVQNDINSIYIARDLVDALLSELVKFDFKDRLKQSFEEISDVLRKIENILYEFSLKLRKSKTNSGNILRTENLSKEESLKLFEFDEIRLAMDNLDEIKQHFRKEGMKIRQFSKKALFYLHRADYETSNELLSKAEELIRNLIPTIVDNLSLKESFSYFIGEYMEVCLFKDWLIEKRIKPFSEFQINVVGDEIYISALCDISIELERYAVSRATFGDRKNVEQCLDTILALSTKLIKLSLNQRFQKKIDTLRNSAERLENILFELSLTENQSQ